VEDLWRPTGQDLTDLKSRQYNPDRPVLIGHGPPEFSTSLELEPFPSIVWDTNLYYGSLGVHRRVGRRDIRQAYIKERGFLSPRLTMIMKTLLDPTRRLHYDLVPLGDFFFDEEIEESQRRKLSEMASDRIAAGEDFEDLNAELENSIEKIDNDDFEYAEGHPRYRWSYYLWKSDCVDIDRLFKWRSLVCQTLQSYIPRGVNIGIGYHGLDDHSRVEWVGRRVVLLIPDTLEPDLIEAGKMAYKIARAFKSQ
jgi:hypothetical protein